MIIRHLVLNSVISEKQCYTADEIHSKQINNILYSFLLLGKSIILATNPYT